MERIRLPMGSTSGAVTLCVLLLLSSLCQARLHTAYHPGRGSGGSGTPPLPRLSNKSLGYRHRGVNGSACVEAPPAQIRAPKKNVWAQLTYEEVVEVREWLFDQNELNLHSGYGYYGYGGGASPPTLGKIELNIPNKTDVLPYLDGYGAEPRRFAKTQIQKAGSDSYKVQEIIVGPIPVTAETTWQVLGYPYSRKNGSIEAYETDYYGTHSAEAFSRSLKESAQDIFAGLWPQLNSSWTFYGMNSTVAHYGLRSSVLTQMQANVYLPLSNGKAAQWYDSYTTAYAVSIAFSLRRFYRRWSKHNDTASGRFRKKAAVF